MRNVLIPNKQLVRSRFSNAACVYDTYAEHHQLIAEKLLNAVEAYQPKSLIELGCGTGILSSRLHTHFPRVLKTFTDIAPGMIDACRSRIPASDAVKHNIFDFEKIQSTPKYDMVVSSCALQWLHDPTIFVQKLSSMLTPEGITAHAIPVQGMLGELENCFQKTGRVWNSLNYMSGDEWDNLFRNSGFDIKNSITSDFTVHYNSPVDALRAIRGIGASLSGHHGASSVSPVSLRKTLDYYRLEYGDASGKVPATYRIHIVTAQGVF